MYGGSVSNVDWISYVDILYILVFFNVNLIVMFFDLFKWFIVIFLCNSGKSIDFDLEKCKECYFDFKVIENVVFVVFIFDIKMVLVEI